MLKKIISENDLLDLYMNQRLSDVKIAEMFGCTDVAISKLRRRYGIPTLRQFDRLRFQHTDKPNVELLSNDDFFDDYVALTQTEFCEKYGISAMKLKIERKRRNLPFKEDFLKSLLPEPTLQQKHVFIGGLLGDGGVYPAGKNKAYYQEGHSVSQKLYLETIHSLLYPYSNSITYYKEKRAGKDQVSFKTKPIEYLKQLRCLFYSSDEGAKDILPVEFLIQNWDNAILSYWYFGDGCLLEDSLPSIGTALQNRLPDLVNFLNEKYKFGAWITRISENMSAIKIKDRGIFYDAIAPYVTADMLYKVPPEYRSKAHPVLLQEFRKNAMLGYQDDLKKYKSSLYKLLSETEKDEWETQVFDYYRKNGFPYIKMSPELLADRLKRIKTCEVKVIGDRLEYKTQGLDVCKNFMPHIYEARVGKNQSPKVQWANDVRLKHLIKNRFKYAPDVSSANMRRGVDLFFKTVANFKPSVSKWICDRYGSGGTVYLPDAGFGGKLLGALVSESIQRIVCLDPLDKTIQASIEMAKVVDPLKPCQFVQDCAEDYLPEDLIGKVDLVLSCPPYFDKETYSNDPTQSIERYKSYGEWVDKFLSKSVDNFYRMLSDNGVYAIVIGDDFFYDFLKCIEGKFYVSERYYVPLGSVFHKKDGKHLFTYESLIILKKGNKSGVDITKNNLPEPVVNAVKVVSKRERNKYFLKVEVSDCIQAIQNVVTAGLTPSRSIVEARVDLFPYSTSSVEKTFGSWNQFLKIAGVSLVRQTNSERGKVAAYRQACQKHGKFLSFYELEHLENIPATRYKRMFNKGKPWSHLKDDLERILLADMVTFERWLDLNFPYKP